MSTPVKPGGRNELAQLKDARRFTGHAKTQAEAAVNWLKFHREQTGRPDYARLHGLLSELILALSRASGAQDEQMVIRAMAKGGDVDLALAERVADLEAQLAELQARIGVTP